MKSKFNAVTRKTAIILAILAASFNLSAQDIAGAWYGALEIPGMQLRIVFHVNQTAAGYTATMDSPDQGGKDIPMSEAGFDGAVLKLALAKDKIQYEGTLGKDSIITGVFSQGGNSLPMNLSRNKMEKKVVVRPQDPVKPYAYYSEAVTFENRKEHITFSGTLTMPAKEGLFPAVILISGSGPQNRDEELAGHKPFLVLSDYFTKNGFAVLRYDDRGTAESNGNFNSATTMDFAADAEAAVHYLQSRNEIDKKKIGLMGHSEGGMIAPVVAVKMKEVSFIVLLSGTGIPGDQLLLIQEELIGKSSGKTDEAIKADKKISKGAYDLIIKSTNTEMLKTDLTNYFQEAYKEITISDKPAAMTNLEYIELVVKELSSPWMQFFIKYDPSMTLHQVACPVLAVNGANDIQVPSKENLAAIKSETEKGGNKKVTVKEYPHLNHLFQECETCTLEEYTAIEQTFSPVVLEEVTKWMQVQIK